MALFWFCAKTAEPCPTVVAKIVGSVFAAFSNIVANLSSAASVESPKLWNGIAGDGFLAHLLAPMLLLWPYQWMMYLALVSL